MESVFHPGELSVQQRAGVRDQARKIGTGIHATISAAAAEFLLAQRFAVLAAADRTGRLWASPLTGRRAFLEPLGERRLRVHAYPNACDPLAEALGDGVAIGLLAIDFASRKRLRLNGSAVARADGFDVVTREVFGNCPRYIQARVAEDGEEASEAGKPQLASTLDDRQLDWINRADTFFIATGHAEAGADVSHRGGNPGFVRVVDARHLTWPDYSGNRMFQTLGNLESDPRAGILFLDFARGRTLQLTGRATVDWDPARASGLAGAERVVDFAIDDVVEIRDRGGLRFRLLERSPFNP
ncbi:MAG TPA: pyridoxamine 5'-phosphate oxidase family protein [Candidatus Binatia bacterium]|nr:pyridoxamine 5'-phosphate oxidase family protein [Candidatus Binatia bacterium]